MKNIKQIITSILIVASISINAQVAINTDGSSPDASAILDVKSTDKVFLPPRMTETQMEAINDPAEGSMVYCTDCSPKGPYYYNGSNWLNFVTGSQSGMSFSNVVNPTTGVTWMDRNLGATQVATSSTDADAYGDLYQWGRGADGHEKRNSGTTSNLSNSNTPGHGYFILAPSSPYDWRNPQNDNLWQGVNGINNPCPSGYRLPTEAEWDAERQSWSSNNATGAFASPLKLPMAGYRSRSDGTLNIVGGVGYYWSSTLSGGGFNSQVLLFDSSGAMISDNARAVGKSVRCIKD